MNDNEWIGRTVWITGAGSGIGKALAIKLVKLGAIVIVSGRREQPLKEIFDINPQHFIPFVIDVSDANQRQANILKLSERVEAIDVAIFAAGVVEYEDGLNFENDRYKTVMDINFLGLVNSIAIAMPLLKKSKLKPYIVGVTSLTILAGFPRAEIYGASKAAADYFLKSLRMDLPQDKFDISIIRPGFVETPMTSVNDFPMPFIITADEAAERMIKAMNKRKFIVNFPIRFSLILKLLSAISSIWYKVLGPKMSRQKK